MLLLRPGRFPLMDRPQCSQADIWRSGRSSSLVLWARGSGSLRAAGSVFTAASQSQTRFAPGLSWMVSGREVARILWSQPSPSGVWGVGTPDLGAQAAWEVRSLPCLNQSCSLRCIFPTAPQLSHLPGDSGWLPEGLALGCRALLFLSLISVGFPGISLNKLRRALVLFTTFWGQNL